MTILDGNNAKMQLFLVHQVTYFCLTNCIVSWLSLTVTHISLSFHIRLLCSVVLSYSPYLVIPLTEESWKSAREFIFIVSRTEVVRSRRTFLTEPLYSFLPVSSKELIVGATELSTQFRLSRVTRCSKSSRKRLPTNFMVSDRLTICF